MSKAANQKIVLAYVDAFNRGDEEAMRPLFTDDALIYGVLGWGGLDQVLPIWREIKAAFDIKLQVESMIAEDDIVAVRYVERGTSVGSFRGGPVTGKSFEVVAMEWFEIKDGKIHRRWGTRDNAAQLRQMGLPLG
ncbi:MAG TPA: ester cyclase [Pyrinomonadaceae bacterium]|nr:ester cyclase [Pyrinomonadaceae bacterium]